MSTVPIAVTASTGGLLLAPITARLIWVTQLEPRRASPMELAAVTVIIGMLTAAARDLRMAPLVALAVAAAVVDLHERRLPNVLTGALAVGTAVVVLSPPTPVVWPAAAAGCGAFVACLAAKLVSDDVIGWGDVKLLPILACLVAAVDPTGLPVALAYAAALLLLTIALFAAAGMRHGEPVPYGPALVVGAFAALPAVS